MKNSELMLIMLSWLQLLSAAKKALVCPPLLWLLPAAGGKLLCPSFWQPEEAKCGSLESQTLPFAIPFWAWVQPNKQIRTERKGSKKLAFQRWAEEFTAARLKLPNLPSYCIINSISQSPKLKTLTASPLSLRWAYPPSLDIKAFIK